VPPPVLPVRGRAVLLPGARWRPRRIRPPDVPVGAAQYGDSVVVVCQSGQLVSYDATTREQRRSLLTLVRVDEVRFEDDAIVVGKGGEATRYDPVTLERLR
jgi:hypothetical protein